jgi:hypothetical protein
MDKVIDLLIDERRWCKRKLQTVDGRHCIAGAIICRRCHNGTQEGDLARNRPGGRELLPQHREFQRSSLTTHALVVRWLRQARGNMLADSPPATRQRVGAWARLFRGICEPTRVSHVGGRASAKLLLIGSRILRQLYWLWGPWVAWQVAAQPQAVHCDPAHTDPRRDELS